MQTGAEAWRYWLNRRRGRKTLSWKKLQRLLKVYPFPRRKIVQASVQWLFQDEVQPVLIRTRRKGERRKGIYP
jgi:hypothetical protein